MDTKIVTLERWYDDNLFKYKSARDIVLTQLKNWQRELKLSKIIRNPIDLVSSRIKTFDSLVNKCRAKGIKNFDIDLVSEGIKDIAGVRVVCIYQDDVYRIENMIKTAPGLSIQRRKDYVANPKTCGYASLHLNTLVQVPSVEQGTQMVPVEIQIRTSAMQAWAQVEHRSQYKSINGPDAESAENLKKLAAIFREADALAMKIRIADGEL